MEAYPFPEASGIFSAIKATPCLPPHPLNGFLQLSLLRRPPVLPLACRSGSTSHNHLWTQFSQVTQSCPTLCDPMDCSMPGFPVHHQLLELTQTQVYPVSDTIQPSHITNSQSLLKLMFIESVMSSNHLILCHPLLLLPSIFPTIRVFSNESVLHIRWLKYWSFSFSISPSNEYSGLISFRIVCELTCDPNCLSQQRFRSPSPGCFLDLLAQNPPYCTDFLLSHTHHRCFICLQFLGSIDIFYAFPPF